MSEEEKLNPNHRQTRGVLRTLGPVVLMTGIVFTGIGLISFFSAFGSMEPPRYFWCAFIGLPMVAFGGMLTKFGYLGAIGRYFAGEGMPVAKDAFNYMADGTKGGVATMAHAVGQGLSSGMATGSQGEAPGVPRSCPACGHANDHDSKFCDQCGAEVVREIVCSQCQTVNQADARFCDQCGTALTEN